MKFDLRNAINKISRKQQITIAAILAVTVVTAALIVGFGKNKTKGLDDAKAKVESSESGGHSKDHDEKDHDAPPKGPHGGKLLADGDMKLEALIAEDADGPHLRIWLFNKEEPLSNEAMKEVAVSAILTRPGGESQSISFVFDKDSLKSVEEVAEPHVFEAAILVKTPAVESRFTLIQEEGKVELTDVQIKASSITVETASSARIQSTLQLPGEIRFNEDRTAHVVPRVASVVTGVSANLGQQVKKGQVLATLSSTVLSEQRSELLGAQKRLTFARSNYEREKKLWEAKISAQQDYLQAQQALNEAQIAAANAQQKLIAIGAIPSGKGPLNQYELRAPFDGVVVEKHIAIGEALKEDAQVFTVSDLSAVWAQISVPAKDLARVRVGEKVTIKATSFDAKTSGTVSYIGSLIGEQTRTATARVVVDNREGFWRPGLFVNVELVSEDADVPVAVSANAIQTVGDKTVVFVKVQGGFIAQPVEIGRSDGKRVEIVKGLKSGTLYAAGGSFIIKSELGKESAEHGH